MQAFDRLARNKISSLRMIELQLCDPILLLSHTFNVLTPEKSRHTKGIGLVHRQKPLFSFESQLDTVPIHSIKLNVPEDSHFRDYRCSVCNAVAVALRKGMSIFAQTTPDTLQ